MSVRLADELNTALAPLDEAFASPAAARGLLRHLGLDIRFPIRGLGAVAARVADVRAAIDAVPEDEKLADLMPVIEAIVALTETVDQDLSFEAPEDIVADIRARLPEALGLLPQYLVVAYLDRRLAAVGGILRAVGVLDTDPKAPAERLYPDRLVAFLEHPRGALIDLYGFRVGQDWESARLLRILDRLLHALNVHARWSGVPGGFVEMGLVSPDHPRFDALRYLLLPLIQVTTRFERRQAGLVLGPLPRTATGPADGLFVGPFSELLPGGGDLVLGGWRFSTPVDLAFPAAGVALRPDGAALVGSLDDVLTFSVTADQPIVVGPPDAPLVTFGAPFVAVELPRSGGNAVFELGTGPQGIRFTLDLGDGDALVTSLMGGSVDIELEANLRFSADAGLELELGTELDLYVVPPPIPGPLSIDGIAVQLAADLDGISGSVGVDASVRAGIVTFAIARVGLDASFTYERAVLDWAFVPPDGVGISVGDEDTPVRGGGFLAFDHDAGRYSGAIDLAFGPIGLTAIGLVETGRDDWTLFVSLSVGIPPIPLPFGFYIDGIGGLLALHRRFDTDALRTGLKDGVLDPLLFPDDPVAQAPALLAAMERVMPEARGTVAFGPVMRISWGVPPVGSIQLGVLVALPEPVQIVLIGQLEVVLPSDEAPIVQIRVDVLGRVDLAEGTLAIDAELHDSWLVGLSLFGSAAVRLSWLRKPSFLVSAGGFHPAFEPPAELQSMRRLTVALDLSDIVEVTAEAYFALTSNTLQFGGRIDLVANLKVARVTGGMGLDVLVQRSPFGFDASADFYASVEAVGVTLAAVRFEGRLKGPKPWSIYGFASVKIAGVRTKVEINATLPKNGSRDRIPAETVDVARDIRTALAEPRAWRPAHHHGAGVSLRDDLPDDTIAPDGSVEVLQNIAPLAVRLDRFGEFAPKAPGPFDLDTPTVGDEAADGVEALDDWFAPATFTDLGDEARLAAPSFEKFKAGIRFGAAGAASPIADGRDLATDYEELLWDPDVDPETLSDTDPHPPTPPHTVELPVWQALAVAAPLYAVQNATTGAVIASGVATFAQAQQLSAPGSVVVVAEAAS